MATEDHQLATGEIIGGNFRVLAKLGHGGMGSVYKVEQMPMGRLCALKIATLEKGQALTDANWQRFKQEAQTLARLHDPNIVQIYDFGLTGGGTPFYVMDFVEGQTLAEKIKSSGQLRTADALAIFIETADGLAHAHQQGIVHRDIKPSNIMIGGDGHVKIVDFGLAQQAVDWQGNTSGALPTGEKVAGSPPYMSPEQLRNQPLDARSDIYSLGCSLFEALTGVPPFIGESALVIAMKHASANPPTLAEASLGSKFPPAVESCVAKMLRKDPSERYQNMEAVLTDLQKLVVMVKAAPPARTRSQGRTGGQTQSATQDFARPPDFSSGQQSSALLKAALIAGPLLLLLAGGLTYLLNRPPQPTQPQNNPALASAAPGPASSAPATSQQNPIAPYSSEEKFSREPYSKIVPGAKGQKIRVFNFPSGQNLGLFTSREENSQKGIYARGQVNFPADLVLRFLPSVDCVNHPAGFRRFQPGDFSILQMENNERVTSEILTYVDHMSNLTDIALVETEITDDCISTLEEFPKLTSLDVSNTDLSGTALAKMKTLGQLEHMRVSLLSNLGPLIKALAASKNLQTFHCDSYALTDEDVANLASMPHLHGLSIANCHIGLRQLDALSKCPELHDIAISRNSLRADIVPYLQKFPQLTNLTINCDDWSKKDIEVFKNKLPNLTIELEEKFDAKEN